MAGKYSAPKKSHWAPFVVILAVAALVATIGGSMAWLTDSQGGLTNTFTPAKIYIEVMEDAFTDRQSTEKTNVYVQNGFNSDKDVKKHSDAPVYIRVALVPTWEDSSGNIVAFPAGLGDLDISWGSDWHLREADGYYYYTQPVTAGGATSVLIKSAEVKEESAGYKAGYHMNLQILAQAVQAEGVDGDKDKAVLDAWGFDPDGKADNLSTN